MSEEVPAPEDAAPPEDGMGTMRKVAIGLFVGLVLWIAGAIAVLMWQPNRFVQVGVIGVVALG